MSAGFARVMAPMAGLVILLGGCASAGQSAAGKAVLDFSRPPNQFYPARLVVLDGDNVNAPISRSSFWVDPGVHEIVISAAIDDRTLVSAPANRSAGTDPGRTTIEVEAGKRYNIGAQLINDRGDWEPVIWRITDQ